MQIQHRGYQFHVPNTGEPLPWSPWEMVGMAAWLWTRSGLHRSWNLDLFEREVLDSLEQGQFVFVTRGDTPAAYLSWAHLSDEAEVSYLLDPHSIHGHARVSGPHLWLQNWVAPYGGTQEFTWVARTTLFHSSVGHMLRVKPHRHQAARLVSARGVCVSPEDFATEIRRVHVSHQRAEFLRHAKEQK